MSIQVNNISKEFKIFKREAGLKGAVKSFFNRKYEIFHALKSISLDINEGEIIGILGENGAGKTTLIKAMVGLLHPTSGSIFIDGFSPWERKNNFLKTVSIVMGQKNQLWWDIPASESFLLNQKIYQIPEKQFKSTLDEMLDLLDVRDKVNVQVRRLSLGERMKMEIISALLHRPKIVFLDEPTIGLDVTSQSRIREFITKHNEQYGTTFLLTSHYMNDIQALCKRVFIIHKGEGLYDGDFETLVKKINPKRRLQFEFSSNLKSLNVEKLINKPNVSINDQCLTAELPDNEMMDFLNQLFELDTPASFSFEELPVEETMKSFFANPEKFISKL
ncbi:MAG: ATP-binding cassette domain-containing protein [Candidatus Marinimicrobia bacterium]|nr:ATP-binding cassette domain-containing protein [Candidatus Neomarinimicrobiota bacterium]